MKVLFVLRHVGFFRIVDGAVRELSAAGHSIEVLFEWRHDKPKRAARRGQAIDALRACEAETTNFTWGWSLRRTDRWRGFLRSSRRLLDYVGYLQPGRQDSKMVLRRSESRLSRRTRRLIHAPGVKRLLRVPLAGQALRLIERTAPPGPEIVRWLREHRPDAVVVSPFVVDRSNEQEYVKAALSLKLPTVVVVASRDNLTTKGVFHMIPDMTLVWNKPQAEEAIRFHDVPPDKVLSTGAPAFDPWFDMQPSLDRAEFCRLAGLDPDQPYALYVGSSKSMVGDERACFEEAAQALRAHPATRHLSLLVRPYPWNADIWQDYAASQVSIWPPAGSPTDTPEARQGLFHSLYYSVGVIGINTSAHIEAAIVDKPCLTFMAERYRDTQIKIAHFQQFTNSNFMEIAPNASALAETLAAILQGQDAKQNDRRRFLQDFVRPWGLEVPARRIMARAIEGVARRHSLEQLRSALTHEEGAGLARAAAAAAD